MVEIGRPLRGRDRLLALMDVGALLCRPREPRVRRVPAPATVRDAWSARRRDPVRARPKFEGSFRQRRGQVMAVLRDGPARVPTLDREALASLVADGLATVARGDRPPPLTAALFPRWLEICGKRRSQPTRESGQASRKLRRRSWPESVRIDSGWNCTPSIGRSRWRRPITRPSSVSAVTSRHVGHRVALDDQRVVAGRGERGGQAGEHAAAVVADLRGLAVHHVLAPARPSPP